MARLCCRKRLGLQNVPLGHKQNFRVAITHHKIMKYKNRTVVQLSLAAAIYASVGVGSGIAAEWSPAANIDPSGLNGVNTAALEGCPIESPDGHALYFASNRSGGRGGIDIWVAFRNGPNEAWGDPQNLDGVNSESDDFCPTPLPGGELLFVSKRSGGCGLNGSDIYFTRQHPVRGWEEPVHLGCDVNSPGDEFAPSYVPADGGMLFFSSNRDGFHKIYASRRQPSGWFGAPSEVVELNLLGANTARPNVSQDGRLIVFDSDRAGGFGAFDLWAAIRVSVSDAWSEPVNLGVNVNSSFSETRPSLSRNRHRLYFGSNKPGGAGSSDIQVSDLR